MTKSSARKLEYGKEYYERNKERIKARRRERWKNADKETRERQREYSLEHYHANKEKSNARTVAWMRENRELVNARARLARYKKQGRSEAAKNEEELIAVLLEKKQQSKKVKIDCS
jgi:hypothetical protein